jgi:hypothetical protein
MHDVECPYCEEKQEINHDDGYGYKEDEIHEQECPSCEKKFAFTTSISYYYDVTKADCLNGGEHEMEPVTHSPPLWPDWVRCKACGHEDRGEQKFRDCLFTGGPADGDWLRIPEGTDQWVVPVIRPISAQEIGEGVEVPPTPEPNAVYKRDPEKVHEFNLVPDVRWSCQACGHDRRRHRDEAGQPQPCAKVVGANRYLRISQHPCHCKAAFEVDAMAKAGA